MTNEEESKITSQQEEPEGTGEESEIRRLIEEEEFIQMGNTSRESISEV